jgi:cell division protein ZapA
MILGAKNRVKLMIAGCEILVSSEDSEDYIRETGARVDEHIRKAMETTPSMSITLAAIFAALDFCDEASKEKHSCDNLRSQIKTYFDDATKAREELQEEKKNEEIALRELKALKAMSGLKALQEQRKLNDK